MACDRWSFASHNTKETHYYYFSFNTLHENLYTPKTPLQISFTYRFGHYYHLTSYTLRRNTHTLCFRSTLSDLFFPHMQFRYLSSTRMALQAKSKFSFKFCVLQQNWIYISSNCQNLYRLITAQVFARHSKSQNTKLLAGHRNPKSSDTICLSLQFNSSGD